MIKEILRAHIRLPDPDQHEIRHGLVDLHRIPSRQFLEHPVPFRADQLPGKADVLIIRKHQPPGNFRQRVDGPGIFPGVDGLDEILIACDRISQPQSRRREEFGCSPQDNQIRIIIRQGNAGDIRLAGGKFHIRLINHDKDAVLEAGVQDPPHLAAGDGGGGGIVGVAQHQQVHLIGQVGAEILHIHGKSVLFLQRIVQCRSSAQGDFPLVFRVGGAQNQGLFRMAGLDKQGDQLRGAIPHDDILKIRVRVPGNALAQGRVLPVRIGGDGVQIFRQRGFQPVRNSQGVHIGAETDDIFLFDMINLLDGFQVAAVEMVFVLYHNLPLFLQR